MRARILPCAMSLTACFTLAAATVSFPANVPLAMASPDVNIQGYLYYNESNAIYKAIVLAEDGAQVRCATSKFRFYAVGL